MSKYIYVLVVFLGFIIGCGKESNLLEPVDPAAGNKEPNWIVLPSAENQGLQKEVTSGKWICGARNSILRLHTTYPACTPFHYVSITAVADVQKNSFAGWTYMTMSVSDKFGETTFSPDINFSKPVIYNLTIMGLDLSSINPETVKFVYMAPDGQYYPADYDRIHVDKKVGMLQVINARLPHFSRYGFAN